MEPRTISWSQISLWKSCRMAYHYAYDLGLQPKKIPVQFDRGSAIHRALAEYYKLEPEDRDPSRLTSLVGDFMLEQWLERQRVGEITPEDERTFKRELGNAKLMMERYARKWQRDEGIPACRTELEISLDVGDYLRFKAKVDAYTGLWLLEHKTGSIALEDLVLQDEQSLYYVWALRSAGYLCLGTCYNIIPLTGEPVREYVERLDYEINQIWDEIYAVAGGIEVGERYPTRGWNCKWCWFKQLCIAMVTGGDVDYLMEKDYYRAPQVDLPSSSSSSSHLGSLEGG